MSLLVERPKFQQVQFDFIDCIRNPESSPPGDVPGRRMATYVELVHNNIRGFIETTLPILRARTDPAVWECWVKSFIAVHRCRSPLFRDIPAEFVAYLQDITGNMLPEPAFAVELGHYEWGEMALFIAPDASIPPFEPNRDLMINTPVLNPVLWLNSYQYPVHRLQATAQPDDTTIGPYFLLRYRDHQDRVRTFEIDRITARLVQVLQECPDSDGTMLANQLSAEMREESTLDFRQWVGQRLERLQREGVVLGAKSLAATGGKP